MTDISKIRFEEVEDNIKEQKIKYLATKLPGLEKEVADAKKILENAQRNLKEFKENPETYFDQWGFDKFLGEAR